jgi:predicted anti-sigma-YlaC factor YlaD
MSKHLTDQQLIDYQFDLAAEADAKEARSHLEKCDSCRRRLHELGRKLNALELIRDDVKASRTLLSQTIHNAQQAGRWRRFLLHKAPWAGAVAAAVVIGIALLAVPDRGRKDVEVFSTNAQAPLETSETKGLTGDVPTVAMAPSLDGSLNADRMVGSVPARAYLQPTDRRRQRLTASLQTRLPQRSTSGRRSPRPAPSSWSSCLAGRMCN